MVIRPAGQEGTYLLTTTSQVTESTQLTARHREQSIDSRPLDMVALESWDDPLRKPSRRSLGAPSSALRHG